MENIRKQLLSLMLSLEFGIISKFYRVPRVKYDNEQPYESPIVEQVVESDEIDSLYLDNNRESATARIDKEIDNQMRLGCIGIRLLFANFRFLYAVITKKTDIIKLILEQYYIQGKINSTTIEAILNNRHFEFSEEERNVLQAYIDSDTTRIVLA